jgi:hypothetical protein
MGIREKFNDIKKTLEAVHTVREFHDRGLMEKLNDCLENNGQKVGQFLKGMVEIVDDSTGEVVLRKHNIILLRGRTFALEKMFGGFTAGDNANLAYPTDKDGVHPYNVDNFSTKEIALFTCGNGGCVENRPFDINSEIIKPNRYDLVNAVPFRIYDGVNSLASEGYYNVKPIAGQFDNDGNQMYGYFSKKYYSKEWVTKLPDESFLIDNDEVAIKLTLKLTEDDFKTQLDFNDNGTVVYKRGTFINELGLQIANPITNSATGIYGNMENIELCTYFNFESEAYYNSSKSSTINYYIYA